MVMNKLYSENDFETKHDIEKINIYNVNDKWL